MFTSETGLDAMVCFAVYSASNAVTKAHRAVLEPWDFTYTQYIALREVSQFPEGLTVKELGQHIGLDSGTLSPLLRRLEQRKMLSKTRSSADERKVVLTTTDQGFLVAEQLSEALASLRHAYGFTSEEEALRLIAQLNRITAGMDAVSSAASMNSKTLRPVSTVRPQ